MDLNLWSSLNEQIYRVAVLHCYPMDYRRKRLEKTLLQGTGNSVSGFAGDIVFQRTNDNTNFGEPVDRYFLALNNYTSVSDLGNSTSFVEVQASSATQGSIWASNETYDSGQDCLLQRFLLSGTRADNLKNNITVNDELVTFRDSLPFFLMIFYTNEYGESVKNTLWAKLSDEGDLNHVFSFKIDNQNQPSIRIPEPGASERSLH